MDVNTNEVKKKVNDIYYTPNLKHNLFSAGQIMENNYKLVFENGKCVIFDKNHGNRLVIIVPMSKNRLFPLKFGGQRAQLANVSIEKKRWLWHLRHGHLNFNSLRLLTSQEMVYGLPKVEDNIDVCEGCALENNSRMSFPKGKVWRAYYALHLVHFDICGLMKTKSLDRNSYFFYFY